MTENLKSLINGIQNFLKDKENIACIYAVSLFLFFSLWFSSFYANLDGLSRYCIGLTPLFPVFLSVLYMLFSITLTESAVLLSASNRKLMVFFVYWLLNAAMLLILLCKPAILEGSWEILPFPVFVLLPFWGIFVTLCGTFSRWIFPAVCLFEASHLIWTLWKRRKRAQ